MQAYYFQKPASEAALLQPPAQTWSLLSLCLCFVCGKSISLELADMTFQLMKNMAIDRGNMEFNKTISHLITEAFWKNLNTLGCNTVIQIMSKARPSYKK